MPLTSPSEAECKRLVEAAVDRFGRLDFLDNNVGIGSRGSVVDEKPETYRRVMQVNVETMFLVVEVRDPGDDQDREGRRHRQHLVDLGAAAARAHHLYDVEGAR